MQKPVIRVTAILVPALLGLLAWAGLPAFSQEKNGADNKEVARLIEMLGDDEIENRLTAHKKLLGMGEDVLPALRTAARTHGDADVKLRSRLLWVELEKKFYGEIRKLSGHTKTIRHIVVSRDGKRALSGAMDNTVRLWDLDTGKELKQLTGEPGGFTWQVAFSPDEKQALSAGGPDKTVRLRSLEGGVVSQTFAGHTDRAYGAAISPDGKYVVTGEAGLTDGKINPVRVFEANPGRLVRSMDVHTGYVWKVLFSPDGKKFASIGCNDYSFRIWDTETGKELVTGKNAHTGWVVGVDWSPDGKHLLTSGRDLTAKLWDAGTGKLVRTYTGFDDNAESLAFSKDGKRFLAGETRVVHVFDTETGKIIHRFEGHTDVVYAVAFVGDGSRAISGGADNELRLWGVPK